MKRKTTILRRLEFGVLIPTLLSWPATSYYPLICLLRYLRTENQDADAVFVSLYRNGFDRQHP